MQTSEIEKLFRLAFEAGEAYADSLEWCVYADNFPTWYAQHKEQILSTINE